MAPNPSCGQRRTAPLRGPYHPESAGAAIVPWLTGAAVSIGISLSRVATGRLRNFSRSLIEITLSSSATLSRASHSLLRHLGGLWRTSCVSRMRMAGVSTRFKVPRTFGGPYDALPDCNRSCSLLAVQPASATTRWCGKMCVCLAMASASRPMAPTWDTLYQMQAGRGTVSTWCPWPASRESQSQRTPCALCSEGCNSTSGTRKGVARDDDVLLQYSYCSYLQNLLDPDCPVSLNLQLRWRQNHRIFQYEILVAHLSNSVLEKDIFVAHLSNSVLVLLEKDMILTTEGLGHPQLWATKSRNLY